MNVKRKVIFFYKTYKSHIHKCKCSKRNPPF